MYTVVIPIRFKKVTKELDNPTRKNTRLIPLALFGTFRQNRLSGGLSGLYKLESVSISGLHYVLEYSQLVPDKVFFETRCGVQ